MTPTTLEALRSLGAGPHTRAAIRKALAPAHRGPLADDLAELQTRGLVAQVDGGWVAIDAPPPHSPRAPVSALLLDLLATAPPEGWSITECAERLCRTGSTIQGALASLGDRVTRHRDGHAVRLTLSTAPAPHLQDSEPPGAVDPSPAAPAPPPEDPAGSTPPGGPSGVEPVAAALAGEWHSDGGPWERHYPDCFTAARVDRERPGGVFAWRAHRPNGLLLAADSHGTFQGAIAAADAALSAAGLLAPRVVHVASLGVAGALLASQECERLSAELAAVTARAEAAEARVRELEHDLEAAAHLDQETRERVVRAARRAASHAERARNVETIRLAAAEWVAKVGRLHTVRGEMDQAAADALFAVASRIASTLSRQEP